MKRRYQAGIIMMLISAMIASNLPMTTVFAAAKKQQVKQETKKLEERYAKCETPVVSNNSANRENDKEQ
jgi:predicted metal-binding membrane protein